MNPWAVIQTETQRELLAADHLARAGFEVYLPRIKISAGGRTRKIALFPSYVFARVGSFWYRARWSDGVVRILMAGDEPAKLKDEIVDAIRKRQDGNGFVKLPPPPKRLKQGDKVQIVGGSFAGQIGLYEGMCGKDRERVLLDLLGQAVAVELPHKDVAPLNVAIVALERRLR